MSDFIDVSAEIARFRLAEHAVRIARLAKPAVRINARPVKKVLELAPNASTFGGPVYLPQGQIWPMAGDRALAQLAQIKLSDVSSLDRSGQLPDRGILQFWYDVNGNAWGFDPKDRDSFRVIYIDDENAALVQSQSPVLSGQNAIEIRTCELSFEPVVTFPWTSWADFGDERDGLMELPGYQELLTALGQCGSPAHRLLGHPDLIQGPMEEGCQLVTHGINCGGKIKQGARYRELVPGIPDWILLLQIDTDEENPGWMWGDVGMLYFWIRRQDLAARNFENCWLILQCG